METVRCDSEGALTVTLEKKELSKSNTVLCLKALCHISLTPLSELPLELNDVMV